MASPPLPLPSLDRPDAATPGRRTLLHVSLAFAFACLLSIVAFFDAWASMVRVWSNSETFAHGFIALPCAAWMLWRRHEDWSALSARVWWPAVGALALCGIAWLVGRLGGVASFQQFGAVGFIPATMLLLVGPAITRSLAFPLGFLFFAVPVGEFLTPIMMDYTADATVQALRWTGIPVFREGLHFSLPTGRWSVVEACSGLRYLIASLALGVLYAYLQFRTLRYRLAFVALAIIVPIVANWVRAYGIVLLGHLSDMRIAAGADHLIYGWVFFGFVMALLFWIGSCWNEPPAARPTKTGGDAGPDAPQAADGASEPASAPARRPELRLVGGIAVAIVAALLWRPLSLGLLDATEPVDAVAALRAAVAPYPPADALDYRPHFVGASGELHASRRIDGVPVDLHAFYYARQHETNEMVRDGHRAVRTDDFDWPVTWRGTRRTPWGTVAVYRIGRAAGQQLVVWHWFAVGDTQTASAYRAKAATAWSLASGLGDHSLAIVLATPLRTDPGMTRDEAMQVATRRLEQVSQALQPTIEAVAHGRPSNGASLVKRFVPQSPASVSTPLPATSRPVKPQ